AVGKQLTIAVDDYQGTEHTLTATVAGVQNESLFGGGAGANATLTDAMQAAQEPGTEVREEHRGHQDDRAQPEPRAGGSTGPDDGDRGERNARRR
ncbi:hypothetical protein IAE22_34200, partial [Bacillus sp. S34]|nr:hypothetical protein [Bacillus sp. S34]